MAINSGTLALSTVAAPLTAGPCREVNIHNDDAAINMLVGNSGAQNYTLGPGQDVYIRCSNRNQIYLKSASGTPTASYLSS